MINQNHKRDLKDRMRQVLGSNRDKDDTVDLLAEIVEEVERSYGNCQACYGKGYSTVVKGTTGYPDFPGDKGFKDPPTTKVKFCDCGRGQALKKLWGGKVA